MEIQLYRISPLPVFLLSEMLLLGTTIDYINEDYQKQLYESKFVFIPDKKVASTCGCGVSFNLR